VTAAAVDDATIERSIAAAYRRNGLVVCPHTATALHVWQTLPAAERDGGDWAVVATAHPAKFEAIVEPLIGTGVELPPALAQLLRRPAAMRELAPALPALAQALEERH
ncbi:MAG: threonine synthase, partial [Pseudomonadota bacterium]